MSNLSYLFILFSFFPPVFGYLFVCLVGWDVYVSECGGWGVGMEGRMDNKCIQST